MLIDRTNALRIAVTDSIKNTVFINKAVLTQPLLLMHVLIHELGHCVMVSYGLLNELHKMVKDEYYIQAEEWVCNIIADHAYEILKIVKDLRLVPKYLDKLYSYRR